MAKLLSKQYTNRSLVFIIFLDTASKFFAVSLETTELKFLSMLYILTDVSILSYVKMLSYDEDLIADICGQNKNSELHKC